MPDEFTGPPRLPVKAGKSGWAEPLTAPSPREPTPFDEEIAATDERLSAAAAETARTNERMFSAEDALRMAGANGDREAAEIAYREARAAWEAAGVAEGRARSRRTALGVVRSDWKREHALEESGR